MNKKEKRLKCRWCGKFTEGYEMFCNENCYDKWAMNTDQKGNKTKK